MDSINSKFFKVPLKIYKLKLSSSEIAVLGYLLSLSGNSIVYPSKKTIASNTGLSKRTVDRAVHSLVKNGYLEYNRGFKKGNVQMCNQYRVRIEKIDSECLIKSPKQIERELPALLECEEIVKQEIKSYWN